MVSAIHEILGLQSQIFMGSDRDLVFPSYSDSGSKYSCPKDELHNVQSIYAFRFINIKSKEDESKSPRRRSNPSSLTFLSIKTDLNREIIWARSVPGDSTVDRAAFSGGTGRHFADALLGRTPSILLRFLQSSVKQQLIVRNHRLWRLCTAAATTGFGFQTRIRGRRSHCWIETLTLGERKEIRNPATVRQCVCLCMYWSVDSFMSFGVWFWFEWLWRGKTTVKGMVET